MKICTKCGIEKSKSEFHKSNKTKDGIITQCKPCKNQIIRKWDKYNQDKKRKSSLNQYYKYHEQKKAKAREYKTNNPEKIKSKMKEWRIANKEYIKQYYEDNKAWFKTWNSKRRAQLINATVPWADLEKIKAIYEEAIRLTKETGIVHHVDHIIPLNSKYVCGLHVEYNLQILIGHENLTKGNKFTPG